MSNFSPSYKAVSSALLKSHEQLIREWANSPDKELADACKMLIDAAEGIKANNCGVRNGQ